MSSVSSLLSELDSIGSLNETVAVALSLPILPAISTAPPMVLEDPLAVQEQARIKSTAAVADRIVERLDGFAQMFQDLREDFIELRRLWSPVEEVDPKDEVSEYELDVTHGGAAADPDDDDDYEAEDTEDGEV
jgi:hypothetical protein